MYLSVSNITAILLLTVVGFIGFSCADDFNRHAKKSVQVTL